MRSMIRKILGVTLLEIMLVLAVAAMIIVMSIRYYQSATTSQQANQAMSLIQAITSAADNIAVGYGNYLSVTEASLGSLIGSTLTSPTGAAVTIGTATATSYPVTIPLGGAACTAVAARLAAIPKATTPTCTGDNVTYTYDASK